MDKSYVLGLLKTTFNNYVVGLLGGFLISEATPESIPEMLTFRNLKKPDVYLKINLQPMKTFLINPNKKSHLLTEHMKAILRSFLIELFEIVKAYSKKTEQMDFFRKADWYQFLRIIRNCLAHDFTFNFNDYDKTLLPVKWKDKEISIDLDGKPLPVNIMNEAYAQLLFNEILQFVESKLN